jgi:hypothetical protein
METNDARLVFHHFETRHPATLSSAHITIAEGSARQCADRARACSMEAAAPPALQNFGALVFRDHTLHLKQEIILRGAADRAVQENDLSTRATKLIGA